MKKKKRCYYVIAEIFQVDGMILSRPVYQIVYMNCDKETARRVARDNHVATGMHHQIIEANVIEATR